MTAVGLGCAKTPALAPHVEISLINCISESQIILHAWGPMPCWRIVFSTFRGCMSFYTARVKLGPSLEGPNVRFRQVQTLLRETSRILLTPRRALHCRPRDPTGFYNTPIPSDALTAVAAPERAAIGTTNDTDRTRVAGVPVIA